MSGCTASPTGVGHALDTARKWGLRRGAGPLALVLSTLILTLTMAPPAEAAVAVSTDTTVTFTLVPDSITLDPDGQVVGFGLGPTHLEITRVLSAAGAFTSVL